MKTEYISSHRVSPRRSYDTTNDAQTLNTTEESKKLTGIPKPRRRSITIPPNDLPLLSAHAHDARVGEAQQGARVVVARHALDVEADDAPVWVAPEEVAAVQKGGPQGGRVVGLRGEGSGAREEGDIEEVGGYGEGGVDEDLGWVLTNMY